MGQRMEEYRDQAEELVRDMFEAGLEKPVIREILLAAVESEAE